MEGGGGSFPTNNRTYNIIHAAQRGNYAVGGFCVYVIHLKLDTHVCICCPARSDHDGLLPQ